MSKLFDWSYWFLACIAVYLIVAAAVPTDYLGDTPDYIGMALHYRHFAFFDMPFNAWRLPGYPLFLTIGSAGLADLWLFYVVQMVVFLGALLIMCRSADTGRWTCLPIAAAAIPYFAYLQKIISPDGFLASLSLLFVAALVSRRWLFAAALAATLMVTKLVFGFAFLVLAFVMLWDRAEHKMKIAGYGLLGLLALIPMLIVAELVVFRDSGFVATFVRRIHAKQAPALLLPASGLTFSCGGSIHTLPLDQLDFSMVTGTYQTAPRGLLSEQQVKDLGCTPADVRAAKLDAILASWRYAPGVHIRWQIEFFADALTGRWISSHASYMVANKGTIAISSDQSGWFTKDEIDTLKRFEVQGVRIRRDYLALDWVNRTSRAFTDKYEDWFRIATLLLLAASLWRLGRKAALIIFSDQVVMPCAVFMLVYALVLGLIPAELVDRYTFPNLLLFCFATARVSALAWGK
jgi:hypothetical protein